MSEWATAAGTGEKGTSPGCKTVGGFPSAKRETGVKTGRDGSVWFLDFENFT